VVRRLHTALVNAMKDESVLSRLRQASNFPTVGTPEEFPTYLATESAKWGEVIRSRGITAE
jgi:tripartite-type tricarboxylate transporter receptor subunit TctC